MDKLNDDALRKSFEKLSAYETQHKGISWEQIEASLPVSKSSYWRKVVAAAALLVLLGGTVWHISKPETTAEKSLIEEAVRAQPFAETENAATSTEPVFAKRSALNDTQQFGLADNRKVIDQQQQSQALQPQPQIVEALVSTPLEGDLKSEVIAEGQPLRADSVAEPFPEPDNRDRPHQKIDLRWWGEAAYMFGVVQPNARDAYVVDNFRFTPGVALRFGADFKVLSTDQMSLFAGPYYQLARKSFNFNVTEFGEQARRYNVAEVTNTHQLGALIRFVPFGKSWDVALAAGRNFKPNSFLLQSTVSISTTRKIFSIGEKGIVTLSASATAPLGDFQYFKYYPIQVSIGLAQIR